MFVDSHCHLNLLNLAAYQGDLDVLVNQTKTVGVEQMLCVGIDLEHAQDVITIAERYSCVYASVGLHPSENREHDVTADELLKFIVHPKVIAVGETGLDYYYNKENLDRMRDRFRIHIRVAKQIKRPLIIHSRNARKDTIDIMREEKADEVGGVMHCFTESWEMAQQAMELGFYISFSGIVTFKNAKEITEVAKKVPLERMLIETDAPYLAPVPYRGKPNEPQYIRFIAKKIAELKNISVEEVGRITTNNFIKLFRVELLGCCY